MADNLTEMLFQMQILGTDIRNREDALRFDKMEAGRLAVKVADQDISITHIAAVFGVSRNTVYKWMKDARQHDNDHR